MNYVALLLINIFLVLVLTNFLIQKFKEYGNIIELDL